MREHRVQRVQADDGGAGFCCLGGEARQCGEVADALIAGGAQRIEMGGDTVAAGPAGPGPADK